MTPEYLRSSYKQYKADSDVVATWLANTARSCGYPRDLLSGQTLIKKQPKLRGRARKLARDAKEKNTTATEETSTATEHAQRYLIAINEFIPLADWIRNSTKTLITVPADIVTTLSRVIAARKQHHRMWDIKRDGAGDAEELKKKNDSHQYLIGVLEQVRDSLRTRMAPTGVNDVPTQPRTDSMSKLINRFEALDVSEPCASSSVRPIENPQRTKQVQPLGFTVQQEPGLGEVEFALNCLFHDLDNIRRYLQEVWNGYGHGEFELVAVSLVTNTAIEFVRGIEEDFARTFPQHGGFERRMLLAHFRAGCKADTRPVHDNVQVDGAIYGDYVVAGRNFAPTCTLLWLLSNATGASDDSVLYRNAFATYFAKHDRVSTSAQDSSIEDDLILLEVFPEFCLLATTSDLLPVEDEMTPGMRLIAESKPIMMWMTFAAQVFLDINHILRGGTCRGLRDLQKSTKFIESSITQVLEYHQHLGVEKRPKQQDTALVSLLKMIDDCINDNILERERERRGDIGSPSSPGPFFLLQQHPLLCGQLCFHIKALTQEISNFMVNAWGGILYTSHLYNAVRQEKMLAKSWEDMNLALVMHRVEDMFIGSFPTTTDDYFKRFALAMGFSAVNFASDRGSKIGVVSSKAGPRRLNALFPVSSMFRPRFAEDDNSTRFSPEDVKTILRNYNEDDDTEDVSIDAIRERATPRSDILVNDSSSDLKHEQKEAIAKLHKRQKTSKSQTSVKDGVRPVRLLKALLKELQSETLELSFDHFGLHLSCWKLLIAVEEAVHADLEQYYQIKSLSKKNELDLPFVVGHIFMTAIRTKQLTRTWLPKKKDVVTKRLFEKAAKTMEAMIDEGNGEIICKTLKEVLGLEVEVSDVIADMSK